jgi:hypothetical protein
MNFVKKVFEDDIDEKTHSQFVRFGKGIYKRRFLVSLWKTKMIKVKGSFEFANNFTLFSSKLGEMNFNGEILSKKEIPGFSGKMKAGKLVYEVKNLTSEDVKEIYDQVYYFLLDGEGEGIKLKIKKKLPKPGKNEDKIDDKFCQLELDNKHYQKVKDDFFWDVPDGKKINVDHELHIDEIIMPKGEKDYAKLRELSKRKGKIIRHAIVDDKEINKEKEFEA